MRHQQSQDLSYQPVDSMSGIMPVGDSYEYERDPELFDIDRDFNNLDLEYRDEQAKIAAANTPTAVAQRQQLIELQQKQHQQQIDLEDKSIRDAQNLVVDASSLDDPQATTRINANTGELQEKIIDPNASGHARRGKWATTAEQGGRPKLKSNQKFDGYGQVLEKYRTGGPKRYKWKWRLATDQSAAYPLGENELIVKGTRGYHIIPDGTLQDSEMAMAEAQNAYMLDPSIETQTGLTNALNVVDYGDTGQTTPETVVQPFTPAVATGSGNIIKDNKGRVRTVADGTSTGGTPTTVVTPPIDTTAATPAEQPWSPIATPPAMPIQDTTEIGPGYEAQTLMTERDKLSRLANIYRQSGQMDKFDELTTQANAKNLESLVSIGFEGLQDLSNRNNGGKLAGVLSQMTGSQIQIQPMDDGTWDIYFNGNLAQSSTTAELTDYAKTVFNSAYRASQAARLAKFQEYEFEKRIDAKYGIQSKNAEIMSQMMKDIATANNQGDLDKSLEIFKNSLPTDPTADGNSNMWTRSGSTITGIFPRGIIEPGIDGEDDRTVYTKSFNVNQDSNIIQGILANALAK
jgi:hypothetical protein